MMLPFKRRARRHEKEQVEPAAAAHSSEHANACEGDARQLPTRALLRRWYRHQRARRRARWRGRHQARGPRSDVRYIDSKMARRAKKLRALRHPSKPGWWTATLAREDVGRTPAESSKTGTKIFDFWTTEPDKLERDPPPVMLIAQLCQIRLCALARAGRRRIG